MALSAKERQAKYREQKKAEQGKRLDMIISSETDHQLEYLALHGNMTKKEYLTQLLKNEYVRKISNNESGFDDFVQSQLKANLSEPPPEIAPSEPQDTPKPKGKVKALPKPKTPKSPPKLKSDTIKNINAKKSEQAQQFAQSIAPIIRPLLGTMSQERMVKHLNEQGIKSPTGKNWHLSTLQNVIKRLAK